MTVRSTEQSSFTKKEFVGLSTDTKPTDGVGIKSTFYETDTGNEYIYDGSAWREYRMRYKDLGLVIDATNVAAGATMQSVLYNNCHWVRRIVFSSYGDQNHDIQLQQADSLGVQTANLVIQAGKTASQWNYTAIGQNQVATQPTAIGYGLKFGIKNVGASASPTLKLKIQLFAE